MSKATLRWGIISTGGIATSFTKTGRRDASDVSHHVAAVGSRSVASAEAFISKIEASPAPTSWGVEQGLMKNCKAYGTYSEVYNDPNVNVVYIGTPHVFHFENARDALNAGKHVLCEKPITFDLEELDILIALAKEKNLFLMEALWARFHPIAYAVEELVLSGKLGKVKRVVGELAVDFDTENMDINSRMIAADLAGGALLDLGPYPLFWTMLVVHRDPVSRNSPPKVVTSYQTVNPRTFVDNSSSWTLEWDSGIRANLSTDFTVTGLADQSIAIQFEEGNIVIPFPPFKAEHFWIQPLGKPKGESRADTIREVSRHDYPLPPGGGMSQEADEVARCIRDGKVESERMPLEESRVQMRIFDTVRRAGPTVLKDMKGRSQQA
ncbi:hypothetical protein P7C73_g5232, partial [Tremellales sp. Uapishka_1]